MSEQPTHVDSIFNEDNSENDNNKIQQELHYNLDKISKGFKINFMKMKDGLNGKIMWEKNDWHLDTNSYANLNHKNLNTKEFREMNKTAFKNHNEYLPKEILECRSIVREINFSSVEPIENFEIVQNYYLSGELIEMTKFHFGFVIPNSTNNWEQFIEAKEEMIPYNILSGKLKVETIFLTKGEIFLKNYITIFYV